MWYGLGLIYVALLVTLGVLTLRNGHGWLFFFGIFFPVLWIIGAINRPVRTRRDLPVEGHRRLAERGVEPALRRRDGRGVRHVGVEDAARGRTGAVHATVDHEGRDLPLAVAVDDSAVTVDGDDVRRAQLGPVRPVRVQEEQVIP